MMRPSRTEQLINYVVLTLFAAGALLPIVRILVLSLQPQSFGGEGALHFENYAAAWEQGRFSVYMRNSIVVALLVVSVALVLPLFFDLRSLGLTDTIWAIALPQIAQSLAFGTFWMRAFFRSVDRSLIEAAQLDGAGNLRILRSVLVPIAVPTVVTQVVLTFMWTWNDFLIPLVMSPSGKMRTAPLGLAFFQGQYTQGSSLLAAGAVLVALPMVILYFALQRHFMAGITDGAVKG